MSHSHPYEELEGTATWKAVERAVVKLVENGDLAEKTTRKHIVGYITEQVRKSKSDPHSAPGMMVRKGRHNSRQVTKGRRSPVS